MSFTTPNFDFMRGGVSTVHIPCSWSYPPMITLCTFILYTHRGEDNSSHISRSALYTEYGELQVFGWDGIPCSNPLSLSTTNQKPRNGCECQGKWAAGHVSRRRSEAQGNRGAGEVSHRGSEPQGKWGAGDVSRRRSEAQGKWAEGEVRRRGSEPQGKWTAGELRRRGSDGRYVQLFNDIKHLGSANKLVAVNLVWESSSHTCCH